MARGCCRAGWVCTGRRSSRFFADIIDAAEAERIGLVNRVVDDAELDAFVDDWAQRLAGGPPLAVAMTKRMLNNSMNVTLEEALDDEGAAQTVNFSTAGHRRGDPGLRGEADPEVRGSLIHPSRRGRRCASHPTCHPLRRAGH